MAYMYTISSLTNVSWRGVVIFIVLTMYSKVNGTKFFFMLDLNGLHHIYGKKTGLFSSIPWRTRLTMYAVHLITINGWEREVLQAYLMFISKL